MSQGPELIITSYYFHDRYKPEKLPKASPYHISVNEYSKLYFNEC